MLDCVIELHLTQYEREGLHERVLFSVAEADRVEAGLSLARRIHSTVDAFWANTGKPTRRLCSIMGQDFELPISIEEMISKLDVGGSGEIAFDELQAVFSERKNVV